ncbi:hypothetical protein U0070_003657, partial [Myodes glareolus]
MGLPRGQMKPFMVS